LRICRTTIVHIRSELMHKHGVISLIKHYLAAGL
jgi:hypothetical protein